jgi:hypothetical protein
VHGGAPGPPGVAHAGADGTSRCRRGRASTWWTALGRLRCTRAGRRRRADLDEEGLLLSVGPHARTASPYIRVSLVTFDCTRAKPRGRAALVVARENRPGPSRECTRSPADPQAPPRSHRRTRLHGNRSRQPQQSPLRTTLVAFHVRRGAGPDVARCSWWGSVGRPGGLDVAP